MRGDLYGDPVWGTGNPPYGARLTRLKHNFFNTILARVGAGAGLRWEGTLVVARRTLFCIDQPAQNKLIRLFSRFLRQSLSIPYT